MKDNNKNNARPYKYDIAISYAGEDTKVASSFHDEFTKHALTCFFAGKERGEGIGKLGDEFSREVYGKEGSQYCVLLVSTSYSQKQLPLLELDTVISRGDRLFVVYLDDCQLPTLKDRITLQRFQVACSG